MKRTQFVVLAVLALGLQGVAQASPYPSDAEASYNLPVNAGPAAEQLAGAAIAFPSDAEAVAAMPVRNAAAPARSRITQAQAPVFTVNLDD